VSNYHINEATCHDCPCKVNFAALRAEVERLKREQAEEVAEFNAGYDARRAGKPDSDEPYGIKYDVWKCGYAWAAYDDLKADRERAETAEARVKALEERNSRQAELIRELVDTCTCEAGQRFKAKVAATLEALAEEKGAGSEQHGQ
jgi:uncharacterized coiled-coil protein SlyX